VGNIDGHTITSSSWATTSPLSKYQVFHCSLLRLPTLRHRFTSSSFAITPTPSRHRHFGHHRRRPYTASSIGSIIHHRHHANKHYRCRHRLRHRHYNSHCSVITSFLILRGFAVSHFGFITHAESPQLRHAHAHYYLLFTAIGVKRHYQHVSGSRCVWGKGHRRHHATS